jgi:hypothetical protein
MNGSSREYFIPESYGFKVEHRENKEISFHHLSPEVIAGLWREPIQIRVIREPIQIKVMLGLLLPHRPMRSTLEDKMADALTIDGS